MKPVIYTIGHSNRSLEDFLELLKTHGIKTLVDIRTVPKSRFNPQFGQDKLKASLAKAGIEYHHLAALGGLRHTHKDSPNTGWRNSSFRGYADYMQTDAFKEGLQELIDIAKHSTTAIMCAEAVPWRCHRSLVADALTVRHIPVKHIMSTAEAKPHKLTEFARVRGEEITYPAQDLFESATSDA